MIFNFSQQKFKYSDKQTGHTFRFVWKIIYIFYLQASSSKPDSERTLSCSKRLSASSVSFMSSLASIPLRQGCSVHSLLILHRRKNSQTLILQFEWVVVDGCVGRLGSSSVRLFQEIHGQTMISQNNNVTGLIWQSRMYQWENLVNNALNCHNMYIKVLVWL